MKFLLIAIILVFSANGQNLPPCPEDPVCPDMPRNRFYPPFDPFEDSNVILQHVDQYDCSNLNLKKRGLSCFGLLPKALTPAQKTTIIQHGKALGYSEEFLNAASDDRLKLINTEFNKYDKFIQTTYQIGSTERAEFVLYYRSIRDPWSDDDQTTVDFESTRNRALAKMDTGKKLSQSLNGVASSTAFYVVPEGKLQQMAQVGSQILKQQPFPSFLFLNIDEATKKVYFSMLVVDAKQYVQRALTKLKNGHPCDFLPCSDPNHLPFIIQMFENVLNHKKFTVFQRLDYAGITAVATISLRDKGIIGFMKPFFDMSYEEQIMVFIHETTHLYGTVDLKYYTAECLALLNTNPLDALRNADSYALEIIKMGRNSCDIKGPKP